MATNLTSFYDELLPGLKGVTPGANALKAIRDTLIDFCERTQIWRYSPAAVNSVAGTAEYALTVPAETALSDILWAEYNGEAPPLLPKSIAELDALFPNGWRSEEGEVDFYYLTLEGKIRLALTPSSGVTGAIKTEVSLKPTATATSVDDFLYTEWRREIGCGARAMLMGQADKPWSNAKQAVKEQADYMEAVGEGGYTADRSGTRAPIRTKAYSR